ncbi:MAG: nitrous oxide reductase family maturation protein NosD [Bacteroidia bacterium]|nr:nitrous oxide reductase family maturation protein NosD [Bacteroidia bacterium]
MFPVCAGATIWQVFPATNAVTQAIAKSSAGDTIEIQSGTYRENTTIDIKHSLHIRGVGNPVLDGQYKGQIMSIWASGTTISGIHFIRCGKSNLEDYAAIKVYHVNHVTISQNTFEDNYFCIFLLKSDSCIIRQNFISGKAVFEQTSGNGIHLWKSQHAIISENKIQGQRDGIYFEFVTNSRIENNISAHNIRYGLHFMFSHRNQYTGNRFTNNGAGVAVMYSNHVHMTRNVFDLNRGQASYGLLLKDISDSRINQNRFEKNSVAIYMEGSNRLTIEQNNFIRNGWAMRIYANCEGSKISNNNFSGNSFDVSTNGSEDHNHFVQNFWDKYEGYDLNHDDIGDIPYRPVSIYAMLMERIPFALILYRSFVVSIFERIEKIMPVITPVNLYDEKPLMKPVRL